MQKLYRKSEISFALVWIAIYVVGTNITDSLSLRIGIPKLFTLIFLVILCFTAVLWIKKNNLFAEYGICKPDINASKMLFYFPLIISVSCNLWFGVSHNLSVSDSLLFIFSMICVGFLEELIFRGFLFKAMSKNGIKSAVIVSSITFGIGHIVNLFNSNEANLLSNLCQVCYAAAFGFLFVIIFIKTNSLLPCIVTHSLTNALSVFSNETDMSNGRKIFVAAALTATAIGYSVFIIKTLPKKENIAL